MPRIIRIKLTSTSVDDLSQVCKEILEVARRTGVRVRGPIPLPTKRMVVTVRKAPSGQGSHTFDHWEMRIHKRIIDMDADDRAMRQFMRIRIPKSVRVEVEIR